MNRLATLKAMRHAARPLRPMALSVTIATVGVGLMYAFLLPKLTALAPSNGQGMPELTRLAIDSGSWWLLAAIVLGAAAGWLARTEASVHQRLLARMVLQLILLIDAAMVGLSLVGFYAAIIQLPQGFG